MIKIPVNSVLIIFLLVPGLVLAGCKTREIEDQEKDLLVTVKDLEAYGIDVGDPAAGESMQVKTNLDGSIEIEYKYDSDNDPDSTSYLSIISETEINHSDQMASTAFSDRFTAYKTGLLASMSGMKFVEDPHLFTLGDENYIAYLEKDGRYLGNVLVTRKENIVFSLLLFGIYFDEKELLEELMAPKWEFAEGYIQH